MKKITVKETHGKNMNLPPKKLLQPSLSSRCPVKFTLIELLVVIAIISIP